MIKPYIPKISCLNGFCFIKESPFTFWSSEVREIEETLKEQSQS